MNFVCFADSSAARGGEERRPGGVGRVGQQQHQVRQTGGGGQIKLIPGATEGRREGRIDGTEILGGAQTSPGVNKSN